MAGSVEVMGGLAEDSGEKTFLCLCNLGSNATPLLRLCGRSALWFEWHGWRRCGVSAVRQRDALLQRTDQDIPFAQSFAQAADQLQLFSQQLPLRDDLLILNVEFTTQHREQVCVGMSGDSGR